MRYTYQGRVQRLFGFYIPPKKLIKADKYLTLRFCIPGIIPSKKNDFYAENNYRMIMNKAFATSDPKKFLFDNMKSWIRGSKKYLKWLDDIDVYIDEQRRFWALKYDIVYPIECASVKVFYYYADEYLRDNISKDEAIYDMLVTKGILTDDNYKVIHTDGAAGACYKGEIPQNLAVIDVTMAIFDKGQQSSSIEPGTENCTS